MIWLAAWTAGAIAASIIYRDDEVPVTILLSFLWFIVLPMAMIVAFLEWYDDYS